MGLGRVTQIMGPVIDVRFEHNEVPDKLRVGQRSGGGL